MKNKICISLVIIGSFIFSSCKKETRDLNPDLRSVQAICTELAAPNATKVRSYSINLNNGSVNVDESETETDLVSEFKLDGNGVDYTFRVTEWGLGTPYVSVTKDYAGVLRDDAFIKNQVNVITMVRDGSNWKLLVNGQDVTISGGLVTGGGTSGACPEGTWYSPACGDPHGVIWKFNSDRTGSFSNMDCNGICTPMVFTFSYVMSGTTCNITYDALQPIVQCTGYADSRPNSPGPASITLSCSGTGLTVTSGNGTITFTK